MECGRSIAATNAAQKSSIQLRSNYFVFVSVIERVDLTARAKPTLSTFDRVGIVVVTLLGTCLGLEIALASDIRLTPILGLLFPGLLIGFGVARTLGVVAGVLVCAATNGAAYGLLLYGWYRFSSALACRIPKWLDSLGVRLSQV